METLTSARNPGLAEIRRAVQRGALTSGGCCVAEGFHLLREAIRSGCEIELVYVSGARAAEAKRLAESHGLRAAAVDERAFKTVASTESSQGVLALVRPRRWTLDEAFSGVPLVVVLDRLQDPGNAGAILRAAEAFGASGVVMLKGSVDPCNPKALRASAGSIFRVPCVIGVEEPALYAALESRSIDVFAAMPVGGQPLQLCRLEHPCVVVIGSEAQGVSASLRARSIPLGIPTRGVESLNAAMAASVILYEARRQREAIPL